MEKRKFWMVRLGVFFVVVLFICMPMVKGQEKTNDRNYLTKALNRSGFRIRTNELTAWRLEQKKQYCSKVAMLPFSVKERLIQKADQALSYDWPPLSASLYLEYKRTGNRTGFERKQTERRYRLSQLVIGHLLTNDKKYLPAILDGLWATLEESSWEIPAIIGLQKTGTGLPDPNEQIIGLVSAETSLTLAAIEFMLHDQLDSVSPMLTKRIQWELQRRIIDPYMERTDWWWMGFKGQPVNNWNAWINTNVLTTALLTDPDILQLNQLLTKVLASTDFFINQYPSDGGCEEGPAYWTLAGGKLARLLYLTNSLSPGTFDWSSNRLLHSMGTYIVDTHIDGNYFVNFADAGPRTIPDPVSVERFGQLFADDSLRGFAAYLFSLQHNTPPDSSVMSFLETAGLYSELISHSKDPGQPAVAFLPSLQVYTARSQQATDKSLFLAVQGGNNGESHNHNDVGNFLLYAGGQPVLVDAGSGIYTAQTFSSRRYELWNMQSQWHNCPLINGTMQSDGKAFKATDVLASVNGEKVQISMYLEKAYPPAAHIQQWKRSFTFDRAANTLLLTDDYALQSKTGDTRIDLLTACLPKERKKGEIGFYDAAGRQLLLLRYPADLLTPAVEEKKMDDEKLIAEWGDKLYRLSFLLRQDAPLKGTIRIAMRNP